MVERTEETEKHQRENRMGKGEVPTPWVLGREARPPTHAMGSHSNLVGKLLHKSVRAEGRGRKEF